MFHLFVKHSGFKWGRKLSVVTRMSNCTVGSSTDPLILYPRGVVRGTEPEEGQGNTLQQVHILNPLKWALSQRGTLA